MSPPKSARVAAAGQEPRGGEIDLADGLLEESNAAAAKRAAAFNRAARPGDSVWVASHGTVGNIISNNPFFKIMHVEVNSAVVEVTYDQCGYVDADLI